MPETRSAKRMRMEREEEEVRAEQEVFEFAHDADDLIDDLIASYTIDEPAREICPIPDWVFFPADYEQEKEKEDEEWFAASARPIAFDWSCYKEEEDMGDYGFQPFPGYDWQAPIEPIPVTDIASFA